MAVERIPVVMDVDTGVDDAVALALATRSPEVELVAVTTLAGNVGVETTTANTQAVLDWLGRSDVPVHRGATRPLVRPHRDAVYFHDTTGLGSARLPPSERAVGPDRGPAALIRLSRQRPGEIVLVCCGPLTNLAIALNVEPDLPARLRSIVVMGGAFSERGNVVPHAEFNVYADPEAAAQVLSLGLPRLTLVPLDVTHRTTLARATWEATRQRLGTVAAGIDRGDRAAALTTMVYEQAFTTRDADHHYLHDPLAVAVAFAPELVECEAAAVQVDTSEERRGETRIVGPGTVSVARRVDVERFDALIAARLGWAV